MSKALMKLRLQKNINRQIQKENYELRMQLQSLEEEKEKLHDQVICHEEFHRGIFHELERKLQSKDHILAPFHEAGKIENENYLM
jgi:predicted SprT family Zn-dependent metalloprotease